MSLVPLPTTLPPLLEEYLPPLSSTSSSKPFVTLTYAQSLDSRISAKKGQQTKISHLETKTMTHYLRSRHDAIFVGSGTVLADDPKLNCRYTENGNTFSPRPVILDPKGEWQYDGSSLQKVYQSGQGLAPFVLIDESAKIVGNDILKQDNGKYIPLPLIANRKDNWNIILTQLAQEGITSVMIEGGAKVINDLLIDSGDLVDSLIITIGPVFLGQEGVEVSPSKHVQLENVKWWTGVQDSVLCATITNTNN